MIRTSDSQVYYKKAVLKSSKTFTEKKLFMSLFFSNKVADLRPETFFRKRLAVKVFSCKFCQIFYSTFFANHVRMTASAKYPFACQVNLSLKMLP